MGLGRHDCCISVSYCCFIHYNTSISLFVTSSAVHLSSESHLTASFPHLVDNKKLCRFSKINIKLFNYDYYDNFEIISTSLSKILDTVRNENLTAGNIYTRHFMFSFFQNLLFLFFWLYFLGVVATVYQLPPFYPKLYIPFYKTNPPHIFLYCISSKNLYSFVQ